MKIVQCKPTYLQNSIDYLKLHSKTKKDLTYYFCCCVCQTHLLKSRIAMTMMMMRMTARTGPITHSISGSSVCRDIPLWSFTMMGSENGLAANVLCCKWPEDDTEWVQILSSGQEKVCDIIFTWVLSKDKHNKNTKDYNSMCVIRSFCLYLRLRWRSDLILWPINAENHVIPKGSHLFLALVYTTEQNRSGPCSNLPFEICQFWIVFFFLFHFLSFVKLWRKHWEPKNSYYC